MGLCADGSATSLHPEAPGMETAVDLGGAVGRAQHGDAEAFRLLYRDIQPRLLRYLHALAGQDAEDIASETWLQVTRDLPGFTGSYDGFRGWVATIARHRALDHLRRTTRRPPALALPAEDLAARPAAADTAQTALDAVATRNAVALIATLPRTRPKPSCSAPSSASTPPPQDTSWANAPEPSAPPPTAASKPCTSDSRTTPASQVIGVLAEFPVGDVALEALDLVALVGQAPAPWRCDYPGPRSEEHT